MLILGLVCALLLFGGRILHPRRDLLPRSSAPEAEHLESGVVEGAGPAISVVIPARNEEHRISSLLESLMRQDRPPAEIIVVDDESTDDTAALCRRYGVTVIPTGDRPPGWVGKTWACSVGAKQATGELLLFLDADVDLSRHAVGRLISAHRESGGAVSVQPYHQTHKVYESFSALFNAQAATAVGIGRRARGLFGPCILIDRASYLRAGGHEAVRSSVLDDVDLGVACRARGVPIRTYLGGSAIRYRMYSEGFRGMVNGWTKNFLRGAGATPTRVLMVQSLWIIGAGTAFAQAALALAGSPAAGLSAQHALLTYLVFAALFGLSVRFYGSFGLAVAITFPLHLLFFGFIMLRALWIRFRGGRLDWRGREVSPGGQATDGANTAPDGT